MQSPRGALECHDTFATVTGHSQVSFMNTGADIEENVGSPSTTFSAQTLWRPLCLTAISSTPTQCSLSRNFIRMVRNGHVQSTLPRSVAERRTGLRGDIHNNEAAIVNPARARCVLRHASYFCVDIKCCVVVAIHFQMAVNGQVFFCSRKPASGIIPHPDKPFGCKKSRHSHGNKVKIALLLLDSNRTTSSTSCGGE